MSDFILQRNHLQHESYSSEAYLEGAELWYISSGFLKVSFVGFLDDICFSPTCLNICKRKSNYCNIARAWSKEIGKQSSSVRIHFLFCQNFCLWVFTLHREMKKGKYEIICVEWLSSITFKKTLTKNVETKPAFFLKKKQLSKKKLNVWNENILHPRKINVKCYIFFIFLSHQIHRCKKEI